MKPVIFSLGSNIGNKVNHINSALDALHANQAIELEKASAFYKTPPWGIEEQDWFVNICAKGKTSLEAENLLAVIQKIEKELGREKTIRWGPRLIDIDILFFGDRKIEKQHLTIPHKSIVERAFVLIPLKDIAPNINIKNKSLEQLISVLPEEANTIQKMPDITWKLP